MGRRQRYTDHARRRLAEPLDADAVDLAAYRIALRERLDAVEIDCYESLVGFFDWLGFDTLRQFQHESYGDLAVMRIQLFDRSRLLQTDSPLVAILDDATAEPGDPDDPTPLQRPLGRARA